MKSSLKLLFRSQTRHLRRSSERSARWQLRMVIADAIPVAFTKTLAAITA